MTTTHFYVGTWTAEVTEEVAFAGVEIARPRLVAQTQTAELLAKAHDADYVDGVTRGRDLTDLSVGDRLALLIS